MSLSKMAPLSWQYYAEEIGGGREDYYAAGAEHPGRFLGRGTEVLGIAGEGVPSEALEQLFGHGCDPRTGRPLGRSFSPEDERMVAGFALTFSPPKTVSVLWALGDDAVSVAVLGAHEAAVEAAMGFLGDHAAFTRRGRGGLLQVDTEGLLAASFVHRTSRAADPQLHTHVLVANKVRALDGKWLSLDARELFARQKAAGMLYKAALRTELTARCGVSWTAVDDNGVAEIEGVPEGLCATWSARRHVVKVAGHELVAIREAELGRSLTSSERAASVQLAAYRTRTPKVDADTPTATLKARWHEEAVGFGHDPDRRLPGALGHDPVAVASPGADELATVVARLEERSATFGRADLIEECARLVRSTDAEAVRRAVEALANQVLADPEIVALGAPSPVEVPASLRRRDHMAVSERHGATRYSTTGTLRREAAVLEAAAAGKDAGVGVVEADVLEAVLAGSSLGEDQERAVRSLVTGGEQVALLVGPAGAGKSRALEAARRAYEAGGHVVLGLAPSAMAASVLEEASGITSETLAKFLHDHERAMTALPPGSVVVVDEAGMARTDDLARLTDAVRSAGAKLVLVGDTHQLGAVGPGGLFRTLVADHGAAELETVRRFAHAWEAAASLRLRARDPQILATYLRYDRIAEGSRTAMLDEALWAWRSAREEGKHLLVLTGDNATADELSRRCRAERVAAGEVEAEGVRIASGLAGIGDEIVTLRNDRRLRSSEDEFVRNGARWSVGDQGADGSLTVTPIGGEGMITLPPAYVAEHVALAYALTIHKAQGSTSDRAVVLVDETTTAAQLYVAMSRGREENRALVVTDGHDPDDHGRRVAPSGMELLVQVVRRDGTEASAHEVLRASLARSEDVELWRALRAAARERIEREAGPDLRGQIAALERHDDLQAALEAQAAAEQRLRRAETERQHAEERLALAGGSHRVHLPGPLGNRARQELALAEKGLAVALHPEQRALRGLEGSRHSAEAAAKRRAALTDLRARQEQRERYLVDHRQEVELVRSLARVLRPGPGVAAEGAPGPDGPAGSKAATASPDAHGEVMTPELAPHRRPKGPVVGL